MGNHVFLKIFVISPNQYLIAKMTLLFYTELHII